MSGTCEHRERGHAAVRTGTYGSENGDMRGRERGHAGSKNGDMRGQWVTQLSASHCPWRELADSDRWPASSRILALVSAID
jgi:hypothetical protein